MGSPTTSSTSLTLMGWVDLPVSIHQGVRPLDLEKGSLGVIAYFVGELYPKWLMERELLLVSYDRAVLVPVIKEHEQAGRTMKIGECARVFDPLSEEPTPTSQYQPWLRSDPKAPRDGIAANLAMKVLADKMWSEDNGRDRTIAFCGVCSEPGEEESIETGFSAETLSGGEAGDCVEEEPLLHFRNGAAPGVRRQRGPDIGEAKLSLVHFIVQAKRYWGKDFDKWLVTSVDTDEWMIILLAMSTGKIKPQGPGTVEVTVQRIVGGVPRFLWVNRSFAKICELEAGIESAWPAAGFGGWTPDKNEKVRLFVLIYLLAGCDFLPAMSGLPFDKMWAFALKSVRAQGVFKNPLFVKDDEVWAVDIDECIKLLATMFFFKNEAAFRRGERTAGMILADFHDNVQDYVDVIRFVILRLGGKRTTATCPGFESLRLQSERASAVMGYWQDGLKETMPKRDFKNHGWGVDTKAKGREAKRTNREQLRVVVVGAFVHRH
ncbi:unnamed protein product [Pylaiella littoralis]